MSEEKQSAPQTEPTPAAPYTYARDGLMVLRVTKDEGVIQADGTVMCEDPRGVVHEMITQLLAMKEQEKLNAIQEAYAQGFGEGATQGTLNALKKAGHRK